MKRKTKEKIKYGLYLIPLALIVIFFLVVPIISVVEGSFRADGDTAYSLYNYKYIFHTLPPVSFILPNVFMFKKANSIYNILSNF